jgi:mRNA interferase YafQ
LLKIKYKKAFEKDTKLAQKRGKDINKLKEIIRLLAQEQLLPPKNHDHALRGNYIHHRECHIEPNWLLIYKKDSDTLILERLGTHSDLFKT